MNVFLESIKKRTIRLYWTLFGWPDFPPKLKNFNEKRVNPYSGNLYTPRYNTIYMEYLCGLSIEVIAKRYNVTRERVRQCCWKAYREATK